MAQPPESSPKMPNKRDMSRSPEAERKARQRQRERSAGLVTVTITLSKETHAALAGTAVLTGGTVKDQAQTLVRITASRNLRELHQLAEKAAALWTKAAPFVSYASFLAKPGDSFRLRDRVLTHEEWQPIYTEMSELYGTYSRRGYGKQRIDSIIRQSAQRIKDLPAEAVALLRF
jgi:hypothetical protein